VEIRFLSRKNTHKLNVWRFWIKGGVIHLYVWFCYHSCEIFSIFFSWIFSTSVIRADGFLKLVHFDEIVEQYIRKKTYKFNVLKVLDWRWCVWPYFHSWIEGDVFDHVLILTSSLPYFFHHPIIQFYHP